MMTEEKLKQYIEDQTKHFVSFEQENPHWLEGQRRFFEQWMVPHVDKDLAILDCACGDGSGLSMLHDLGYRNLQGVELQHQKFQAAAQKAKGKFGVINQDMHDIRLHGGIYDLVYSSHTLEHSYNPEIVIKEFWRLLKLGGRLYVVLPFPDTGPDDAHCGKFQLKTHADGSKLKPLEVARVFSQHNFDLIGGKLDTFREPEIWMAFKKIWR